MVAARGLKEFRVPEVEISDLEWRLVEVILGALSMAKEKGKSIVDESLMEEATKYSLSEPRSFLSFEGSGSSFFL